MEHEMEQDVKDGWVEGEDELVTFKQKKGKFSRRTQEEMALGFVVHLLMLFYWVFVHVYDGTVIKSLSVEERNIVIPNYEVTVGRWKYLTYINLWACLIYFFLAFFTDIMPRSPLKGFLQNLIDFMFTSIVFPLAVYVNIAFWIIYAINREGVYKSVLDDFLPPLLNHLWHSFIVVSVIMELLLVYHPYPSTLRAASGQFVVNIVYTILNVYLRQTTGRWMYPFLGHLPAPLVPLFFAGSYVVVIIIYFAGKGLAYLRWGERITATIKGEVKED